MSHPSGITKHIKKKKKKKTPRKHKKLSPRKIGDHVRLHDGKTWSRKGKVIKRCEQLRSYFILKENGCKPRRNRQHLLAIHKSQKIRIFPSPKRTNTSLPEISEQQPTTTEQMVRTCVGRKVHPPCKASEYKT